MGPRLTAVGISISARSIAVLAAVALTLAGCTGGGDDAQPTTTTAAPTTTSSTTTTAPEPVEDAFATVAAALAGSDPDEIRDAMNSVTPDSPAAAYLIHRSAVADATGGLTRTLSEARIDRYVLCSGTDCVTFADPDTSPDGLLFDFSVDDRVLSTVMAAPGDVVAAGTIELRLLSGYLRADDRLVANLEVTNRGTQPITADAFAARLDAQAGSSIDAIVASGGGEVSPGASVSVLVAFDDASLDGAITLSGTTNASNEPWQAVVPVSTRP